MAMSERSIVVGVFTEPGEADRAIEELQGAGFSTDQIRVEQQDTGTGPVAAPGGTAGGTPSGFGTTAGTPAPVITPDEPTRQGGLIGSIKRLFTGRKDTGIAHDLVDMGVPQEEADYYQSEYELGRTIVAVEAGDRREDAILILRTNGASDVTTPRGTTTSDASQGTYDPNAPTGTTTSNVSQGTYDPNTPAGTTTPNVLQGTYDPNVPQGTDDSMARPETDDTQTRQTNTWDDR